MFASLTVIFTKKKEKKPEKKIKKKALLQGGQGRAVKVFAKKILPHRRIFYEGNLCGGDFFCKTKPDLYSPKSADMCVPT